MKQLDDTLSEMRRLGIDRFIRKGARMMLQRLLEMNMLSIEIPKIPADTKSPFKKANELYENALVKQMLEEPMFLDGVLLGEKFVPFYGKTEKDKKGKQYKTVKFALEKHTMTITVPLPYDAQGEEE